jgi:TonB family protein
VTLLLDIAVRGSLVLAVGLLMCVVLRRRAPALRHAVLVVALTMAPLIAPLGLLLPAVAVPLPGLSRIAALMPSQVAPPAPARLAARPWTESAALQAGVVAARRPTTPDANVSWTTVAVTLWALGAALLLGSLLASTIRLAVATRRARPVDRPSWNTALTASTRAAGVTRDVRLQESPRGDLLATWGWRRPRLLIPAEALDWPDERIRIVLGHELAHISRGDWAWQVQAAVVRALFWWNPLAWLACHRVSVESERACDDAVLALGVAPHIYAEQLLAVARVLRATRPSSPLIAVSMARPSTLHRRITAMLNPDLPRSTPSRLTTAVLVGAVLALLVPVAVIRGAIAQAPLEGVVYDSSGAVVPEVRLTLDGNGRKAEATTDAEGRFAFPAVEPGAYVLESAVRGFKLLRQPIELKAPADWSRVITLQLGTLKETISVRGRRGSGAATAPAGPVRVRVGGNIRPPMKLKDVKPVYPAASQEAGHEGVVEIEAVIGKDGSVTAARVTSPEVYPELAAAAVDAVRRWTYSATLLNGTPVEVVMSVSISFALE